MKRIHAKKLMKGLSAFLAGAAILMGSTAIVHADKGYTYAYDYWGDVQDSPDAYEVVGVYTLPDMGYNGDLSVSATGLTVVGSKIYICDTGNNRILEVERQTREDFKVVAVHDKIGGNVAEKSLNKPQDLQIDEEGYIYICDTGNFRILKLDSNWNYVMEFVKPEGATLDEKLEFQPTKLVVDTAGRVYCIASGINKGLLKYEADGVFSGFVGATPVVYEFWDYVWKRLATQEQRDKMESFVPTEYSNVYMDHDGFIYACSANLDEDALKSGSAKAIRKLNLMGSDILIRNGEFDVYGDLYMGNGGGYSGSSKIVDVTVFENDVYVLADKERGRMFAYDDQGRMLYAFGGKGPVDGYFSKNQPVSLDHIDGYDLIALDAVSKTITVFTPTEYGKMIFQAIDQFDAGEYNAAGETWQKVLDLNGNYDLAYIGVGRSLLRQERYEEAMKYFELKYDDQNYSKAFKQYRKQWVEDHILAIFILVFALLLIPMFIGKLSKIKHEIDTADIFKF